MSKLDVEYYKKGRIFMKRKFQNEDIVTVSGGPRSRFNKDPNGKILSYNKEDGTYSVELWGVVGPGDSSIVHKVPEESITLVKKQTTNKLKYEDTIEIKPDKATVWLVQFRDTGEKAIMVWHKNAVIEDVIQFVKTKNVGRKFKVTNVSAGEFMLGETIISFGNSRGVDQDYYVTLD